MASGSIGTSSIGISLRGEYAEMMVCDLSGAHMFLWCKIQVVRSENARMQSDFDGLDSRKCPLDRTMF